MEQVTTAVGMPLDEFIRLYDREGPFELINGERKPKMPNVAGHNAASNAIFRGLDRYSERTSLGVVMHEAPFVLSYTANWVTGSRIPDVMYYRAERLEAYKAATPDWKLRPYVLVPDLVVEVVSPSDNLTELDDKVDVYLADGVNLVWVVDPQREKVSVYTLVAERPHTKQHTTLKPGDTLSGGDLMPGFEIAVATIFA